MFQTSMCYTSTALYFNHEWLKFRANWLYQKLCGSTALYINEKNLESRLPSLFCYFTLKFSYHFSNKAVELQFLLLPSLKSDTQRHLMSNNGTMSEELLQIAFPRCWVDYILTNNAYFFITTLAKVI